MLLILTILKLFLVLVYFVNENLSVDIYISLNGKDTHGCGNKTTMCQSLQFVLQQTKHIDLTIHLDGGSLKPFAYIQNKTMIYNGRIVIKKMAGSFYKPIIQADVRFSYSMYIIEFPSIPNLELDSIIFRQINLVSFNRLKKNLSNISGKINISYCDRYDQEEIFREEHLILSGPCKFISITIDNLKIKTGLGYLIDSTDINELNLSVRNSFIVNYMIMFNSQKGSFTIYNTALTGSTYLYPNGNIYVSSANEVIISNVDFSGSVRRSITITSVKKAVISQSHFRYKNFVKEDISFDDIETLIITNCTFVHTIHGIVTIKMNTIISVTLANCFFERIKQFVIHISNTTNVKVINTHFIQCSSPMTISNVHLMNIENSYFMENGYMDYCFNSLNNSVISCVDSNLTVFSSSFTKNCARKGAAINSINCSVEISTSNFIGNNADSAGTFYFDSNTKAILSNVSIISPVENIPLFTTIIESANITTFVNVNITILNTTDSVDMLMFNARIKGRFKYSCPLGRKVSIVGKEIWKCLSCEKGKYSLKSGFIYVENKTHNSTFDIGCKDCPPGGTCNHGILSKGNFWGYVDNNEVKFIPCLKYYCCDDVNTVCSSISTCYFKREGRLCGRCLTNHYIGFLTNECFPNDTCNRTEFWCIFTIVAITFLIFLAYFKDISKLVKAKVLDFSKHKHEEQLDRNLVEPLIPADESTDRIEFKDGKANGSTGQGILKILINFYQLNMLINVPMHMKTSISNNIVSDVVQTLFTLKLTIKKLSSSFCPMKSVNAIMKLFIKDLVFILLVLLLITFLSTVFYILQWFKQWKQSRSNANIRNIDSYQESNTEYDVSSNSNYNTIEPVDKNKEKTIVSLPFNVRCKVCMLQVFLIGYTNIATFTLQMLNCVKIKDDYYLYIFAEELCFAAWQYGVIIFFICWVVPFSLTLYFSTLLLRDNRIIVNEFLFCLIFPPTLAYLYLKEQHGDSISRPSSNNENTHILSVLQDSFRKDGETQTLWDSVILVRRIIVIALVTFLINPIPRLCCVFFIFVLYLFHHEKVLPYCMPLLNNLESFCLLNLCFLTCVNLFRAFVYVYSLHVDQLPMNVINEVFNIYELILMTLPITISVFYILWFISTKVVGKLHQLCIKKNN